jgi:predicted nucleotidyltransferase
MNAPLSIDNLFIRPQDKHALLALLDHYLPEVSVWAYGSRTEGKAHDASDLDLALRAPNLSPISITRLGDFQEALTNSNIPILVEARDWATLPAYFHAEILRHYIVLKEVKES